MGWESQGDARQTGILPTTDSFEHKITENVFVFVFAHAILKNKCCALS